MGTLHSQGLPGTTASHFVCLQDDQILAERKKEAVVKTGRTIQKSSPHEIRVEEPEQRPTGQPKG